MKNPVLYFEAMALAVDSYLDHHLISPIWDKAQTKMHIYLHLGNYQTQITDSYKQTLKQMLVSVWTVQICFS